MQFSEDKINEINQATDLLALVRQYVDLKRSGTSWKGLCPFHNEKTPSFVVHPDKHYFHCFGCGVGGSPTKFLMLTAGLTFPEALRDLAQRAGVSLPEHRAKTPDDQPLRSALYEVMKVANEFFRMNLWSKDGVEARRYLSDRGLVDKVLEDYSLGLSFDSWDMLLKTMTQKGFSNKILLAVGLIRQAQDNPNRLYDAFRNRIMIPIQDVEKRVVAFAGRTYHGESAKDAAKYINSQTTALYAKGKLLYGFPQARAHIRSGGLAFVVEGYFDLISLVSCGVKPVVASMGTALTQSQVNILRGQAKEVQLVFDSDQAGELATTKALPLLFNAEMDGRVIRLPAGEDPDTYIRKYGAEAFFQQADQAKDIAEFFVERLMAKASGTVTGQSQLISAAKDILSQVPDQAKGQWLRNKLADRLGITRDVLPISGKSAQTVDASQPTPQATKKYDYLAMRLLEHVLTHPESAHVLKDDDLLRQWPNDGSKPLFLAIFNQLMKNDQICPEKLVCDEDTRLASTISRAMFADRRCSEPQSVSLAAQYKDKLQLVANKRIQREITSAIRAAEAAGDDELVNKLIQSKSSASKLSG
ncbi:MAG: DNA primase [Deltaproteobacteria bacterium]|jgi:DNA primase|nr:DNA primase [Deltaproteobacteria bacterium]